MSRPLSDPYNPGVYALLLRSGVAERMRRMRGKMTGTELLRAFRKEVCFAERQRLIAKLREIAPLGLSAYSIKMGKGVRV